MFLIKGPSATILYTGDFRIHLSETRRIRSLFSLNGKLIHNIDSCYVDTTFCLPIAFHLPSRNECLNAIISLCSDWFSRSQNGVVQIECKSRYGLEFVMVSLAKHFKCKVQVKPEQFAQYQYLDNVRKYLTVDSEEDNKTKIRFCTKFPSRIMGNENAEENVLKIIPTVMYFTKRSNISPQEMFECVEEKKVRVCYSSHSSFEEVIEFLRLISPRNVYPNVIPADSKLFTNLQDVKQLLVSYLYLNDDDKPLSAEEVNSLPLPSSRMSFKKNKRKRSHSIDKESLPLLASPPLSDENTPTPTIS